MLGWRRLSCNLACQVPEFLATSHYLGQEQLTLYVGETACHLQMFFSFFLSETVFDSSLILLYHNINYEQFSIILK